MHIVRTTIFALGLAILFAAGITFAAWQGTTWISSGAVIDATKIKDNFDYLYSQVGSSQWVTNGSNIYYSIGNVGIGIPSPSQKLSAAGIIESTTGGFKFPDGTIQTTAAASSAYQTFNTSGTWTKPTKGTVAFIECWGGGGGANGSAGGGGGGYSSRTMPLSGLPASVSITIGAGGAAGAIGGTSSFGSYLAAYGGGGGGASSWAAVGGSGGGPLSAGSTGSNFALPGEPRLARETIQHENGVILTCYSGGGEGVTNPSVGGCAAGSGYYHGGGGSGGTSAGASVYGGGGGAGNYAGALGGGISIWWTRW